jgi:hypothetical protein
LPALTNHMLNARTVSAGVSTLARMTGKQHAGRITIAQTGVVRMANDMKPSKEMQDVRKAAFNLWLTVYRWYKSQDVTGIEAEEELNFALGTVRLTQDEIIEGLNRGLTLTQIRDMIKDEEIK